MRCTSAPRRSALPTRMCPPRGTSAAACTPRLPGAVSQAGLSWPRAPEGQRFLAASPFFPAHILSPAQRTAAEPEPQGLGSRGAGDRQCLGGDPRRPRNVPAPNRGRKLSERERLLAPWASRRVTGDVLLDSRSACWLFAFFKLPLAICSNLETENSAPPTWEEETFWLGSVQLGCGEACQTAFQGLRSCSRRDGNQALETACFI